MIYLSVFGLRLCRLIVAVTPTTFLYTINGRCVQPSWQFQGLFQQEGETFSTMRDNPGVKNAL